MKKFFFMPLFSILLSGCMFTPTKDKSRFYSMRDVSGNFVSVSDVRKSEAAVVAISIETIPGYADCPQIMTLKSRNEFSKSEINRWAEPFRDNVSSLCKTALQKRLGDNFIVIELPYEQKRGINFDYKILVKITDFIFSEKEKIVTLRANWFLYDEKKNEIRDIGEICLNDITKKFEYQDIVDAMKNSAIKMVNTIGDSLLKCEQVEIQHITGLTFVNADKSDIFVAQGPVCMQGAEKYNTKISKLVKLNALKDVYVVVTDGNGDRVYSGCLKSGAQETIPCTGDYEIRSSDDSAVVIKEDK